jgi:hypothetical protein
MPHFDLTVNVPTFLLALGFLLRIWNFLTRLEYKINTMWTQFLIEHPEYERREALRGLR